MAEKTQQGKLIEYVLAAVNAENSGEQVNLSESNLEVAKGLISFIDEIPGGFFVYHADGNEKIIYANQATLSIFGCDTFDEFLTLTGGSFRGLVYPDDLERVELSIVQQVNRNSLDYVEYRIVRKDGQIRRLEDYGHLIQDEHFGKIFYVFITDATDKIENRIREEAELLSINDQNEKLQQMLEEYDNERKLITHKYLRRLEVIKGLSESYESILHVDITTDIAVAYTLSPRTKTLFKGELDERSYSTFAKEYIGCWVHPDDRETVRKELQTDNVIKRLKKTGSFLLMYRCIYDGEVQHIQLQIATVGDKTDDNLTQFVFGFRRVDEEIEKQLKQQYILESALEEARQANAAKDIFLSNISHDMRTPLNAIMGFTKLALQSLDDKQAIAAYMQKISEAGAHVLNLTENVLTLSLDKDAGGTLSENEFNIKDIISEVCEKIAKPAKQKNISITSFVDVAEPDVFGDGEKIKQIIAQFADNAVKYNNPNGKIEIWVHETERRPNGFNVYRFEVKDDGMGIDEKFLPRIFTPFERERNTTSVGVFGAGLGLTIAKRFADLLGGKIDISSVKDKGSNFTFTVCLKSCCTDRGQFDMLAVLDEIRHKKILIVEDNPINLEIETFLLQDKGFLVESAENGKVAVDKLLNSPEDYFSVVLMDIQMPVMNGWEAAIEIRKFDNPAISEIPIIAVSANAFESDKKQSAKAGIDAHLSKPLDIDHLLFTMSNIVYAKKQKSD